MAGFLVRSVPPIPWQLMAHGPYLAAEGDDRALVYAGEGMNASVAVTRMNGSSVLNLEIGGRLEASTDPRHLRLQRMLGHLPALLAARPRSILVAGCGSGVTAGSFLTYPDITNVTICEIESLIPKFVAPCFKKENYDLVHDSRVRILSGDARQFILTSHEKFDIITADPGPPWVKGAAALGTREYFQLCRRRLNPGGIVAQWAPFDQSDLAAVKSEMAAFFDVFPNGTLWNDDAGGAGCGAVMLGSVEPLKIDLDQLQARWQRQTAAAASLKDAGFASMFNLLATYVGQAADLRPWLADAQMNCDRNLRLQYLAGLAADLSQAAAIAGSLPAWGGFPDNIFTGSVERKDVLRLVLEAKSRR